MKKPLSITDDQAVILGEMFKMLGDPSRLKIMLCCLDRPTCVTEVAEKTKLSTSLVSHHFRLLRGARLVRAERRGKQVFYVADDDCVRCVLKDMVNHVCESEHDS